jgi:hypothetical protein
VVAGVAAPQPAADAPPYYQRVTSKDQLLQLVEHLPEEQAAELLKLATERYGVPDQRRPMPAFVGIGDSGRSDISERVDDLLADGFGRP